MLFVAIAATALVVGLVTVTQHKDHSREARTVQAQGDARPAIDPDPPSAGATDTSQHQVSLDTDQADSETEVVHYLETSPGITTKAYSCEPNEVVRHSYDDYSDETLAELAYSDAEADEILAYMRDVQINVTGHTNKGV